MKISISWLQEKNACPDGIEWFRKKYSEQLEGVEYQSILDDLGKENKREWAEWLLSNAGSTNDTLEIEGDLILEHSIFFAGSIKVSNNIFVSGDVTAGGAVTAGWTVKAGGDVKAGGAVTAGGDVKAGGDYGIYVGLSVRVSQKVQYAIVYSKTRPENLILGEWKEMK